MSERKRYFDPAVFGSGEPENQDCQDCWLVQKLRERVTELETDNKRLKRELEASEFLRNQAAPTNLSLGRPLTRKPNYADLGLVPPGRVSTIKIMFQSYVAPGACETVSVCPYRLMARCVLHIDQGIYTGNTIRVTAGREVIAEQVPVAAIASGLSIPGVLFTGQPIKIEYWNNRAEAMGFSGWLEGVGIE